MPSDTNPLSETDPELARITDEEEQCLEHVSRHLNERVNRKPAPVVYTDYDVQMLDLRDQIASARLEDIPPLIEQMERLQSISTRKREPTEIQVDVRSPYFGHLVLEEGVRRREVLIGRGTYLDTPSGVRIVDWRDAPVSRLYYRYSEGEAYDEVFGEREVSGTVVTRRSMTIADAALRRIQTPQGTFARSHPGSWRRIASQATQLSGGSGSAARAEQHHRPGRLGTGQEGGEDRHLKEITPLIDRRQFELISSPNSGLVVIQGGAGSGKTTIGLHRMAYLAFQDSRRFRSDRMLVVVFNDALARYISHVLPALGIDGVAIRTYEGWANRLRHALFLRLPGGYREDTPAVVTRFKKHPAMLKAIEAQVAELAQQLETAIRGALDQETETSRVQVMATWQKTPNAAVAHRLHGLLRHCEGDLARELSTDGRHTLERVLRRGLAEVQDVIAQWAELLSDRTAIDRRFAAYAPDAFSKGELDRVHAWCSARAGEIFAHLDETADARETRAAEADAENEHGFRKQRNAEDDDRSELMASHGADGRQLEEGAKLDVEDDTLLLRLSQRLRGPLTRGVAGKEALIYEHLLVDEAQDLSPVELATVLGTVSPGRSITLAGDVQQRLLLDNGFSNWKSVLGELGFSHVEVEPLKISYRSTQEIIDLARSVLGPLASADPPVATRHGAPVQLFTFAHTGDCVGFLAEALRGLVNSEPNASVAVVTRYAEQADIYYQGLERAEVPNLRRVAEQDFTFRPGVDVTDVRQVKGLEFDYVVIVEATEASYPVDDEARHLLHIAATRSAHQLWLMSPGRPSPLLPQELLERMQ